MKKDSFGGRKVAWFAMLAMALLLVVHPPFARMGDTASAQTGAGERKKPKPKPSPRPPTLTRGPRASKLRRTRPVSTNPSASDTTTAPTKPLRAPEIEIVLIPSGTFTMGSPDHEQGRFAQEGPQHHVTVQSFYMGKYEITQAEYQAVMGVNPSSFKGENRPVEQVSWNDAVEFCRRLSKMKGHEYRLPTEAEWEYACRAGTQTPFAFGSQLSSAQANFNSEYPYGGAAQGVYRRQTTPVGSFQPNAFGLYDMHGNVWEWCLDNYHVNYDGAPTDGSAWLSSTDSNGHVWRGGSWDFVASDCRSANRVGYASVSRSNQIGFRVVTEFWVGSNVLEELRLNGVPVSANHSQLKKR